MMTSDSDAQPVSMVENPASGVWLRRFSKLLCFSTLALVFIGSLVTSHDAGLSVPDWPTTFDQNMFLFPPSQWVGNIFYEHGHRLAASAVGLLTVVLAFWLVVAEPRKWVRRLGMAALAAVILQGVLGGLTVRFLLPAPISVSHAVLAQCFFILTVILAYSQSRERRQRERQPESRRDATFSRWALILTACIFIQLILGAFMRHTESGLAIPDFPTTAGRWLPVFNPDTLDWINQWRFQHEWAGGKSLPPVTLAQVLIHFLHRIGAMLVALAALAATCRAFRSSDVGPLSRRGILVLDLFIVVQILFGALAVWSVRQPYLTSAHVLIGAGLLGLSALLALRALPLTLRSAPRLSHQVRPETVSA